MHINDIPNFTNLMPVIACVILLLIVHFIVPRVKRLDCIDISILNSIAGGIGLGAVLLHLLPDIAIEASRLAGEFTNTLLGDFKILLFLLFLVILFGLCAMYTLEKLAHARSSLGKDPENYIYRIHLGIMLVMFFSMVSVFPLLFSVSIYSLYIITALLLAELIMEDHALVKHFGARYNLLGRSLVALSIVLGLLSGLFLANPEPTITKTFINAFIAGILLLAIIKTEFDLLEQKSHFPTFLISVLIKIVILIVLLFLERHYHA